MDFPEDNNSRRKDGMNNFTHFIGNLVDKYPKNKKKDKNFKGS